MRYQRSPSDSPAQSSRERHVCRVAIRARYGRELGTFFSTLDLKQRSLPSSCDRATVSNTSEGLATAQEPRMLDSPLIRTSGFACVRLTTAISVVVLLL